MDTTRKRRRSKGLAPACDPDDLEAAVRDFFSRPLQATLWTGADTFGEIARSLVRDRGLGEQESRLVVARAAHLLAWIGRAAEELLRADLVAGSGETVATIHRAVYEAGAVCVVKKDGLSDSCMRRRLGLVE